MNEVVNGIWEGPRFICNLTNFNAGRVPQVPGTLAMFGARSAMFRCR